LAQTPGASAANAAGVTSGAGLSILKLLAKKLGGDDKATSADADSATSTASTKSADDSQDASGGKPNAIALALFSQSLVAALSLPTVTPPMAASPGPPAAATAGEEGATDSIADATQSTNGSSLQDLVSLMALDVATDSKAKTGSDLSQLDAAAPKTSATDTPSVGAADASASSAGPASLAHLGIASHFSLQRWQSEPNTTTAELRSPVGSSAWNDELGGHLTWMTSQGMESGSLRLSPEHLGPLEVHISVQNGDASVWFGAHQADTRAALEQALPRLREMFAHQGLTLTDSGVSRESPRNQSNPSSPQTIGAVSAVGSSDVSVSSAARLSLGLVDTYA
jgi:flagellar hook-length control protein FliK